jgi:hypothetical protein
LYWRHSSLPIIPSILDLRFMLISALPNARIMADAEHIF